MIVVLFSWTLHYLTELYTRSYRSISNISVFWIIIIPFMKSSLFSFVCTRRKKMDFLCWNQCAMKRKISNTRHRMNDSTLLDLHQTKPFYVKTIISFMFKCIFVFDFTSLNRVCVRNSHFLSFFVQRQKFL